MAPPRPDRPRLTALDLPLETARLCLRPLTEADVPAVFALAADPALPRYMAWTAHADERATRAFVREARAALEDGTALTLGVEREGAVIGCASLDAIRWELGALRVDRAELGYWIGLPHVGHGFGAEAARALVQLGFDALGLHKIGATCVEDNAPSRRVIEAVGFRLVGRHRDDVWRDGRWHAVLRYELLAHDYSDITTTLPIRRVEPAGEAP